MPFGVSRTPKEKAEFVIVQDSAKHTKWIEVLVCSLLVTPSHQPCLIPYSHIVWLDSTDPLGMENFDPRNGRLLDCSEDSNSSSSLSSAAFHCAASGDHIACACVLGASG